MEPLEKLTLSTGDGHSVLELLPADGGIINRLMMTSKIGYQKELIAGLPSRKSLENNQYYRGVPMYPFANRLEDGKYTYQGKTYQLTVNEESTSCSLHGFLMHITPDAKVHFEKTVEAELTLRYKYDGSNPGYPFPADIYMRYQLNSRTGLTLTTSVENLHSESVPLSLGWHPFLTLNDVVDDQLLHLPPVCRQPVDERLLPQGRGIPFKHFFQPSRIGADSLDACLEITDRDNSIVTTRFLDTEGDEGIELWQETENQRPDEAKGGYRHIHLFIHPDRKSIAIEPVTSGINAFNTKQNLIILQPGQWFTARCGIRLI